MDEEKRLIQGYEVKTAIHISGKEVIFAENPAATEPYMVCNCKWDNPFSVEIFEQAVVGENYLEMMSDFLDRVSHEIQAIAKQREARGVSHVPLTVKDCIENSHRENYIGKLVVIKPENMAPAARTADSQLLLAMSGNGCNPKARGSAVFCKNLFTGKDTRWERHDVAGIIHPDHIPPWAHEKLPNYLKSAEMSLEQNYNQIDGTINNIASQKADLTDGQTFDEIRELAPETLAKAEKSSILGQLKEGKGNAEKRPRSGMKKTSKNIEESR